MECLTCEGSGKNFEECKECDGDGDSEVECEDCHGTGDVPSDEDTELPKPS